MTFTVEREGKTMTLPLITASRKPPNRWSIYEVDDEGTETPLRYAGEIDKVDVEVRGPGDVSIHFLNDRERMVIRVGEYGITLNAQH